MKRPIIRLSQSDLNRFWALVRKSEGCWEWQGSRRKNGYGRFSLNDYIYEAHVVAYTIANGVDPVGTVIRHSCDNAICCRPEHLLSGSDADNTQDMMTRGRHRFASNWKGSANPNAVLSDAEVAEIRQLGLLLVPSEILKLPRFKGRISISGLKDILARKVRV